MTHPYDARYPRIVGWGKWEESETAVAAYTETHEQALIEHIRKHDLRRGGFWHQYHKRGAPVFSDGAVASYTLRAWGGLLSSIFDETPYYGNWAWDCGCDEPECPHCLEEE